MWTIQKCICFGRAISEHLYTQSNIRKLLKTASFDAFSLDYYPEDMVNEATGQTRPAECPQPRCSAQRISFRTLIILLKIFFHLR